VRRDLAALFDESATHQAILDALNGQKPAIVTEVRLFDVYRGADLGNGRKSLAFSVLLQDTRKTLTDAEVDAAVTKLRDILREQFDATPR
jgi:phenylalanyl-tRNA synthetase beta chain